MAGTTTPVLGNQVIYNSTILSLFKCPGLFYTKQK
jgi:hypothetical protein